MTFHGKYEEDRQDPPDEVYQMDTCKIIGCISPVGEGKASQYGACSLHYHAARGAAVKKEMPDHLPRSLHWTTKDGRRIPIEQMSDRHLLNTIKMLERNFTFLRFEVDLAEVMELSGFLASDIEDVERELFAEQERRPVKQIYPIYEDLTYEATKRGLEWEFAGSGSPR